jgi:putative heme-binding domain-containing protein
VASRFDRRALLESILEPSKVVAEVYRNMTLTTRANAVFEGRVVSEDSTSVMLATNPIDPDRRQRFAKADILSQRISGISPMPEGLLNTLTKAEILDLVAWIESGGNPPRGPARK